MKFIILIQLVVFLEQYQDATANSNQSCDGDPPVIENGTPLFRNREHGRYVFYVCNPPLEKMKGGTVRCFNGSWIGQVPECLKEPCDTRTLRYLGLVKPSEQYLNSSESFDIVCEIGYRKSTSVQSITCNKRKWNVTENPCEEEPFQNGITCPMFQNDNMLSISYSNGNKMHSVATFRCSKYATCDGAINSTCQLNGTWSASPPVCEIPMNCTKFPNVPNLQISYSKDVSATSIAIFICSSSHILVGKWYSVCQYNGTWKYPLPSCEEITCPMFKNDNMLSVSYSKTYTGNKMHSVATFRCSRYSRLVGAINSTCQLDGTWSASPPICEITMNCTQFPNVPNLQISYSRGVSATSIAIFNCSSSHILVGKPYSICQHNGTWNNPLPSCEGAPSGCVLERKPGSNLRIQPLKDSYRFGEFILLSCLPWEVLTTSVKRLICLGDKWSDPMPDCILQ